MSKKLWYRRAVGAALVSTVGVAAMAGPADAIGITAIGPSTSISPYVLPSANGVLIESLLTVNDPTKGAANDYEMVGIPDGMGAYTRADGKAVVYVNHELASNKGIVRDHGQIGAFVSRYVVDPVSLKVIFGKDLMQVVSYWDYAAGAYTATAPVGQTAAFSRFCAGTTTQAGHFYNPTTGAGTNSVIHFAGEESGSEGRAVATLSTGVARTLPRLGMFSFENIVPAANQTDKTLVATLDDQFNGRLGMYVGTKRTTGGELAKAGLTSGSLKNVKLADLAVQTDAQFRTKYDKGDAVPFGLVDVNWDQTGAAQKAEAEAKGAFLMNRIEDGHWDPNNPNDLYFLTTDGGEGTTGGGGGGLWRLRYNDIENPTAGGTLTLLLDGTETIGLHKPDNMVIDGSGNLLIQEDPGNVDAVARIVAYRTADGATGTVAQFDPAKFDPAVAGAGLVTRDEESSGIIDASNVLGSGWYLFDAQAHTPNGLPAGTGPGTVEEYVENGQLLAMRVTDWTAIYGS